MFTATYTSYAGDTEICYETIQQMGAYLYAQRKDIRDLLVHQDGFTAIDAKPTTDFVHTLYNIKYNKKRESKFDVLFDTVFSYSKYKQDDFFRCANSATMLVTNFNIVINYTQPKELALIYDFKKLTSVQKAKIYGNYLYFKTH